MFEGWTSPFAQANQQTQDRATAWDAIKADPSSAALIAGLSLLSNNNGSRSFGQLVGRAGLDTLAGLGSMEAQRLAQERYQQMQNLAMAEAARKRQKDAWDMGMQAAQFGIARDKLALNRAKHDAELAGWRMLQGMVGGGMGVPSAGSGGAGGTPNSSNPLNMRVPGGTDFQSFDSPVDAFNAYLGQLRRYQGRGLVTPAQMIAGDDVNGKYVPGWAPAADGNDTDAYIHNVGQWSGIDMFAPINLDDPVAVSRLMSGMARMEQRDGSKWTPEAVRGVLYGGQGSGDNPLAPGQVPDSVPRVQPPGTIPQTFGGVDRATLERVALLPGEAGAAARQILGMRKDAFGAKQAKIGEVSDLGKRWLSESQNFLFIMESANQLLASARENSAAGDIGMIFTFMKALDPTSVVREGEQASAQNAAGVPERVRNVYNNLLTGQRLSPKQRNEFISLANGLVKAGMPEQERRNTYFRELSKAYNIDPAFVVRELYPGLTDTIDAYLLATPQQETQRPSDTPGTTVGNSWRRPLSKSGLSMFDR